MSYEAQKFVDDASDLDPRLRLSTILQAGSPAVAAGLRLSGSTARRLSPRFRGRLGKARASHAWRNVPACRLR